MSDNMTHSHNPFMVIGTALSASATTASLLNQLPSLISALAGVLTIIFMIFQISKAWDDMAERHRVAKLARIAQTVVAAKQIADTVAPPTEVKNVQLP